MNNSLSELTAIVVTYKTDIKFLKNCLNSIDSRVKVIIVENSKNFIDKNEIENQYKNVKIVCSGSNLGYGAGNNFGLKLVDTNYALISNPDVIYDKCFFENINFYLNEKINFSIIGTQYKNKSIFVSHGFFDKKNKTDLDNNVLDYNEHNLKKCDWVIGCSMVLNLNFFKTKNIFDENFFLYFEEFDLCKQILNLNGNVFSSKILLIDHLAFKGSFSTNEDLKSDADKLREWHWMWSTFYFYKKNYGYLNALKKTIGKLIRSLFKIFFYSLIFKKKEKSKYVCRFMGLINSILGKKSFYRVDSKYQ